MEMENSVQQAANELALLSTQEALKKFDTAGSPIQVGDIRVSSKG